MMFDKMRKLLFGEEKSEPRKDILNMSNYSVEARMADSLLTLGKDRAQARLNYFKSTGDLSDFQYIRLWHLVNTRAENEINGCE